MSRCDIQLLTAFVDGALPPKLAARAADHIAACPECARLASEHKAVKARMALHASAISIPAGLESRISTALDTAPSRPIRSPWRGVGRFGAPIIAVAAVAGGLWFARPAPQPLDVQAVIWQHIHAINPPPGESLQTSNADQGRQWLAAHLKDTPQAPTLAAPLIGVGACHIGDEPTAIYMYSGAKPVTLIEVYASETLPAWRPASCEFDGTSAKAHTWHVGDAGGYNAVTWQAGGRTFALVSSMPKADLVHLLERSP